jgi:hypothetical protein
MKISERAELLDRRFALRRHVVRVGAAVLDEQPFHLQRLKLHLSSKLLTMALILNQDLLLFSLKPNECKILFKFDFVVQSDANLIVCST